MMKVLLLAIVAGLARGNDGSVVFLEGTPDENDFDERDIPRRLFRGGKGFCPGGSGGQYPSCFRGGKINVFKTTNGNKVGEAFQWFKDLKTNDDGSTLEFQEFIVLDLRKGFIYTTQTSGGTYADPTIIPAEVSDKVFFGGAAGDVLGGTGKYASASGKVTGRIKADAKPDGSLTFFDELLVYFEDVKV